MESMHYSLWLVCVDCSDFTLQCCVMILWYRKIFIMQTLTILADAGDGNPGGVIIGLGIPGGGWPIIVLRGVCFGPSGTCWGAVLLSPVSSFSRSSSLIAFTGGGFFMKRLGGISPGGGMAVTMASSCKESNVDPFTPELPKTTLGLQILILCTHFRVQRKLAATIL